MDEGTKDSLRFISRMTNPDHDCPACAGKDAALQVADEMAEAIDQIVRYFHGHLSFDHMIETVQRYREARALSHT